MTEAIKNQLTEAFTAPRIKELREMRVVYNFYKEIDGMKVYKSSLDDKYIIEFKKNEKTTNIHFYFDYNGDLIIDNVYKNMRNYSTYRYIKKYADNQMLRAAMMQLKHGGLKL